MCSTPCARRRSTIWALPASTRTATCARDFRRSILGLGKTPAQIAAIAASIAGRGHSLLVTRATPEAYAAVRAIVPDAVYHEAARAIVASRGEIAAGTGTVLVVCAGTSDLPVAEEAAVTAEVMGNTVERLYDVGVAGLHRLLSEHERLRAARVLIVVAGMEGALPSVVAGLVEAPVIAVPTSVGYGASFGGIAALLGMLNSCANGVAVVNIDNGFGAACVASAITPWLTFRRSRLRAIEFDRIVSIVAGLAVTPTGRERLEAMAPLTEPARVGAAQAATTEGVRFLSMSPGFPLRAPSELESILDGAAGRGARARAAEPARPGRLPRIDRGDAPRHRVGDRALSGPQAAGRGHRVVWRARSPPCGARSNRRAKWPTTPARRWRASASGCGGRSRSCARRSNRSCASATRRSTCRSRWSPTATAATC